MICTLTPKEIDQRMLDECPRFAGDEQIRAEMQRLIDALPTEPLPLPKPAPAPSFEDWLLGMVEGAKRMATDEAYRRSIEKRLF